MVKTAVVGSVPLRLIQRDCKLRKRGWWFRRRFLYIYRRRLRSSPATSYENLSMKLLGVRGPLDSLEVTQVPQQRGGASLDSMATLMSHNGELLGAFCVNLVDSRTDRGCDAKDHSLLGATDGSLQESLGNALIEDRTALLLITDGVPKRKSKPKQKRFRFEAVWLRSKDCKGVIERAWAHGDVVDPRRSLLHKLRSCREDLSLWDKTGFGNITKRIKEIDTQLKNATHMEIASAFHKWGKALQPELEELLDREETLRKQRGKALWLKEGDRNTAFFHARATEQSHRKEIKDIEESCESGEILSCLEPRVMEEMNEELCCPFMPEEVKSALVAMHPLRSPRPDGMSPIFYQKCWYLIGPDICSCVLQILNERVLNSDLNHTHIVLLPKCANPELVSDFHPIFHCNVVYKLASKAIANRLKPFLNTSISNSQSAFVLGHLIFDNVLVAYEVNHYLAHKYQGLETIFVALIMLCVSSVSFSLILNGSSFGCLRPGRGLRQGDPLSPYLFLFCAEAFSGLVRRPEVEGSICGVRVSRSGTRVSYLLFADDTLIFCDATREAIRAIRELLTKFEGATATPISKYGAVNEVGVASSDESTTASPLSPLREIFSTADFFTSPIVSNPSFTWRSIVAARPMVMCGLRWEVGDGVRIRVLGDPWLPHPSTFRIISNPKSLSPTTSVLALLDDGRNWKEDLIMGEFERRHILYSTNYTKKCS
ncbi:hypothetical protein Sango_1888500 [Sesamum angolense]|uniref:Reverse transcriptase domain-containing protein n=1 Tax=Sesamum angolense TaxID=2727404 RepID=A0AAE1WIV0_9LAMI|nr:hypothetical protein Sango_1888500 [Sesamum angolense]